MRTFSLFLFVICLNMSAFIINQSGMIVTSQLLYISPFDVSNQFNLILFAGVGIGGAISGIIGLLTRQYVYAAGALLIWVIGIMLPILQWFLIGAPIILAALLPSELGFISYVVEAFFYFILFMFMVEVATQRQVT